MANNMEGMGSAGVTLENGTNAGIPSAPSLAVLKGQKLTVSNVGMGVGVGTDIPYAANRTGDTNKPGVYTGAQGATLTIESEADSMKKAASLLIENRLALLPDVQRNFSWIISVDLTPYMNATSIPGNMSVEERLAVACQQVTPPAAQLEQIEENFMGDKQYHAGKRSFAGTMQLAFIEREDGITMKAWELWANEVFNNDHRLGLGGSYHVSKRGTATAAGYSRNLYVWNLNYENTAITQGHVALNAWPTQFSATPLAYSGAGSAMQVNVTVSLDKWLPVL